VDRREFRWTRVFSRGAALVERASRPRPARAMTAESALFKFEMGNSMKQHIRTIVLPIAALGALAMPAQAPAWDPAFHHSHIIVFDAPNAGTASVPACAPFCGTQPLANNDEGAIVGTYTDANVVPHEKK